MIEKLGDYGIMQKNVSFSVKITEQDLYRYNIHHAYTSTQGIFSIIVAALLIVAWVMKFDSLSVLYRILYPVIALLFLVYIPMNLKLKSKQQMTQEVFEHPLTYELKDTGIVVTSPAVDEPSELPWDYIYKIVTWKEYLLIYSNRINAYIIPRDDILDCYDDVIAVIKEHVEDYKLTIK